MLGPAAGEHGGEVLYSGPLAGLADVSNSTTARYLFGASDNSTARVPRTSSSWLKLQGVSRNNVSNLDAQFPLGVLTVITGVSGSGKSSLVTQALAELVAEELGEELEPVEEADDSSAEPVDVAATSGRIVSGMDGIKRLVQVDQKPIGRTPRSNLATYTGLFDGVRKLFCGHQISTCAEIHRWTFLLQRCRRPLRNLRRRRICQCRVVVSTKRLRTVSNVSRCALQRGNTQGSVSRKEHRGCARDDR